MLLLTEAKNSPPIKPPNNTVLAGSFEDYIIELGDRISQLSLKEAEELHRYLNYKGKV